MKRKILSIMLLLIFVSSNVSISASSNLDESKIQETTLKIWDASPGNKYFIDEYVSDGSIIKKVTQNFTSNGDYDWWNAPSLFIETNMESFFNNAQQELETSVDFTSVVVDALEKVEVDVDFSESNEEIRDNIYEVIEDQNTEKELSLEERNLLADNLMEVDKLLGTEGSKPTEGAGTVIDDPTSDRNFTESSNASNWNKRRGNILVSKHASYKGFQHGHTAILSNVNGHLLEATPTVNSGAQVFHRHFTFMWPSQNYVDKKELYIPGASWAQYDGAINYANAQHGEPYAVATTLWSDNSWYCSKLVYKAFLNSGIDLQPTYKLALGAALGPGGFIASQSYILPADIMNDHSTSLYSDIGYGSVGAVR
jgi:uncharacterized protein YycO